ncbi:MAG: DoxX family protein [Chloroflexota bacterium]
MNIVIWIVQILLALAFGMAGILKTTQPLDKLSERMGWVKDFPPAIVRLIGTLELLAAIGLILPALTGILPILTPLAAVGLVLTMIGAALTHARRGEYSGIGANIILLLLAAFVVYGRFVAVPL